MQRWPSTDDLLERLYSTAEPSEAVEWDLPSFLAGYTLHDSLLAEVRLEQSFGLLVLIDWDMFWNRRVLPKYSNLVIGVPLIYSVTWSQGSSHENTLSGATSERVSQAERALMLENGSVDLRAYQGAKDKIPAPFDDEGLTRTTLVSVNWSLLAFLHASAVKLLCLDEEGRAGLLPVDRASPTANQLLP